jgi:two-component system, LytTR family, response regulator
MNTIKAIIVEDELMSQQYLKNFLQQHFSTINVVAIIDNLPDAVDALKLHVPDIVFLDIEIKMGTGFDVLAAIPDIKSEIIFTTAFNQFAIEAFKYHAIDYLLKPLEDKRVFEAVSHCIKRLEQKNSGQQITQLLQSIQRPALQIQHLGIHTLEGIEFINIADIVFAEAKGNYTELKLNSGATIVASKKLKEIEQSLTGGSFFRIHNSYVVNMMYIKKYNKGRGGDIILKDGSCLPVSATRKDDFLKYFGEV